VNELDATAEGEAAGDGAALTAEAALAPGEASGDAADLAAGSAVCEVVAVGAAGGACGEQAAMRLASGADAPASASARIKPRRLRPSALFWATTLEMGFSDIYLLNSPCRVKPSDFVGRDRVAIGNSKLATVRCTLAAANAWGMRELQAA
jgi:hypothetical protein